MKLMSLEKKMVDGKKMFFQTSLKAERFKPGFSTANPLALITSFSLSAGESLKGFPHENVSVPHDLDFSSEEAFKGLLLTGELSRRERVVISSLKCFGEDFGGGLTAYELGKLHGVHRQFFAPRLTELYKKGFLERWKDECSESGKTVWRYKNK